MKSIILKFAIVFQVLILKASFCVFQIFPRKRKTWIIGTDEVAGVLYSLSKALSDNYCVNLSEPSLRHSNYSYVLKGRGRWHQFKRLLFAPVLLGYLMNQSDQFFYIWSRGFLIERKHEFEFLKQNGKRIALMFCGDDIRSPELQRRVCSKLNRKTFSTAGFYINPPEGAASYEKLKKKIANESEQYADVIFNAPICQTSYLSTTIDKVVAAHGFILMESINFCSDSNKFNDLTLKIVHAPSSEAVKGTEAVRRAIERLSIERNDFVYIELINKKHDDVIRTLKSSHICLNQFLSFGTGVLGIEGMAARCATLMSADPALEPSIPRPLAEVTPWLVTGVDEIYENLKHLLDNRDLLKAYANAGYQYALQNYSHFPATKRLVQTLRDFGFFSNISHEMDPICVD